MKRMLSFLMALVLVLSILPLPVYAAEGCANHPEHVGCGYAPAVAGVCAHTHGPECYPDGNTEGEPALCTHVCSTEAGCTLAAAEVPCGHACELCHPAPAPQPTPEPQPETPPQTPPETPPQTPPQDQNGGPSMGDLPPACTCDKPCTETEYKQYCPVCGQDWTQCAKKAPVLTNNLPTTKAPNSVTITNKDAKNKIYLYVDQNNVQKFDAKLEYTTVPAGADVYISSYSPDHVTVGENGELYAHKQTGSDGFTVTVSLKNNAQVSDTCYVVVMRYYDVISISYPANQQTLNLNQGDTTQANLPTFMPSLPTNKALTWSSSDTGVATVDPATGQVTAVGAGTATITATSVDNSDATASYQVKVTAPNYVAEVTVNGVTTSYTDIAAAFDNAAAGATVKLLANVNIENDTIDQDLTLDLGDQILTVSGSLTINANVTINTGAGFIFKGSSGSDAPPVEVNAGGVLTATGSGLSCDVSISNNGTISGGSFTGTVYCDNGSAITGGNFGYVTVVSGASVTVTGGTFMQKIEEATLPETHEWKENGNVEYPWTVVPKPVTVGPFVVTGGTGYSWDETANKLTITESGLTVAMKKGIFLPAQACILVNSGVTTLTLAGVNITANGLSGVSSGLAAGGSLTLTLAEGTTNTLRGPDSNSSTYGIKSADALTMTGGGSLTATAGNAPADGWNVLSYGIWSESNIVISGGNITATGQKADISRGIHASGTITINGGSVNAITNEKSASHSGMTASNGVTITGGSVTATGGNGIGSANGVTIEGGTITATGSSGYGINSNNIKITGGSGTVKTTSDGSSDHAMSSEPSFTNVIPTGTYTDKTVSWALVTYTLTVTAPTFDAVTQGYTQPAAQPITITSTGNSDAAISKVEVDSENFTIGGSGATVPKGGSLTTWTVQPKEGLARGTYTATITVTYHGTTATAPVSFTVNCNHANAQDDGDCTTAVICPDCQATVTEAKAEHTFTWAADNTTITGTCGTCQTQITAKMTATDAVYDGKEHKTATVAYSDKWDQGELTVTYTGDTTTAGTVTASIQMGEATVSVTYTIAQAKPEVTAPAAANRVYDGTEKALLTEGTTTGGFFMYSLDGTTWTDEIPTAADKGDYTVHWKLNGGQNYESVSGGTITVQIALSESEIPEGSITTYKGANQTSTFIYGDAITVKVPVRATGKEPSVVAAFFSRITGRDNKVTIYGKDNNPLAVAELGADNTAELTLNSTDLGAGIHALKASFSGNNNMEGYEQPFTVTVNKKEITATVTSTAAPSKEYDGTTNCTDTTLRIVLNGLEPGDTVTSNATYAYDNANVGESKKITATIELTGEDAENYVLKDQEYFTFGKITLRTVTVTANNLSATVGDTKPELTYGVTGLLDGDELTKNPTISCDADMAKAGTYEITVKDAEAGSYYTLVYKNGTLTVSAKPIVYHTVKFDTNGGSSVGDQTVEHGEPAAKPADPAKKDMTFGGWFKDEDCKERWDFAKDKVTRDTTLYAQWLYTYEVEFRGNTSAKVSNMPDDIETLSPQNTLKIRIPANMPKRSGYSFAGWYKSSGHAGTRYNPGDDLSMDGNTKVTLYARWKEVDPTNAKTGDYIMIAVAVLAVSGAALAGLWVYGKKKKK